MESIQLTNHCKWRDSDGAKAKKCMRHNTGGQKYSIQIKLVMLFVLALAFYVAYKHWTFVSEVSVVLLRVIYLHRIWTILCYTCTKLSVNHVLLYNF